MNKLIVKTENLTKTFEEGRVIALQNVNIAVKEGEFISIIGPSGSGKSTLLNMIGALDKPTSGRVLIDDEDITGIKNLDKFRSEKVGFVFQMFNLLPTLNAVENVEIPMYELKTTGKEQRNRAVGLLKSVGLEHRMYQKPTKLSGGERQRVAIARALANRPRLVLADEPTGTVDTKTSTQVINLMRQLNKTRGTTFIIVTHDPNIAKCTDRVIQIVDGKVLDNG